MSRYSRLSEERLHKPLPSHGEDNNTKKAAEPQPQHRRVTSASNIRVIPRQVPRAASPTDPEDSTTMPEPPEGMDDTQRLTWQAQWAEALKKVQSLRVSGSQSERWSGLATDLTPARTSLDRWNYYPGPSANRSDTLAWTHQPSKLKGRGSRSVTSFEPSEPPTESYRAPSHRMWTQNAAPVLKKAISMREGGAHQAAVLEMARAYTDTVCGVPKTLNCDSCGRSLGIIVQGNPGVEVAFCQACRPPKSPPKPKKKKNAIMHFCRRMLRLDHSKKVPSTEVINAS